MSSRQINTVKARVAKIAAVAIMAFMMVAGGATVAQAAAPGGVTVTGDVSTQACVGKLGGVWCYGSTPLSNGNKQCYSDYRHDSRTHFAAVSGGSKRAETWQGPGVWAKSSIVVPSSTACSYAAGY